MFTTDALNCQKQIAKEICRLRAGPKGNPQRAHEEIKTSWESPLAENLAPRPGETKLFPAAASLAGCQTVGIEPGRLETRRNYPSTTLRLVRGSRAVAGLRTVGMVDAVRETGRKRTLEQRHYLSSLPLGVERFARAM